MSIKQAGSHNQVADSALDATSNSQYGVRTRYITTTLPYVNSDPHIGFGAEIVRADCFVRFHRLMGSEVFFNTGTDEHGQKIFDNAIAEDVTPQAYVDRFAEKFKELVPALGISPDVHFIRTTDTHHIDAAQEMWRRCFDNGDIYKAKQLINYCVGCELEKTDSELIEGRCELHPNKDLEIREEENYFFRFSKYQKPLLELYKSKPQFVVPDFRLKEITTFVEGGLRDFSVSRLKEKMPWGIPVPGDDKQVMYVWFDALTNYISTLGWPDDESGDFKKFWIDGAKTQVAGKDNLRQQSAIWQAMLLSAQLPNSDQVVIGGFINSGGQKMSKSLGNTISPYELVSQYGTDAARYLLLRHVHPFDDTDITWDRLNEWYTANLVNGLGNLVSRVMKMAETHLDAPINFDSSFTDVLSYADTELVNVADGKLALNYKKDFDQFQFHNVLDFVWSIIGQADEKITVTEPFKLVKTDKMEAQKIIAQLVQKVYYVATLLKPLMPDTSAVILKAVAENKKPENLFARLEK